LWIRSGRKIRIRYRNQKAQDSERPVIIGYAETVRLLAAWCESRRGFPHFRTDRILGADFLDEGYSGRPSDLRPDGSANSRPSAVCACPGRSARRDTSRVAE
jgi:predicted DNA-binding transcriptional regulator YafY